MDKVEAELFDNLRDLDKVECEAIGLGTDYLIEQSVRQSKTLYIRRDTSGRLLYIAGVRPYPRSDGGCVWMMGTKTLEQSPEKMTIMVSEAKGIIADWLKEYGWLSNVVYVESKSSIRWIKFLGASFGDAIEYNGRKFLPFLFRG